MANSTVVETHVKRGRVGVIDLLVTADSEDSPAGSVADYELTTKIGGLLLALETVPTGSPTDNYDVVLNDAYGHDVLEGVGANRDLVNTEKDAIVFSGTAIHPPVSKADTLTLSVTNNTVAGAQMRIRIYYRGYADGEL